MAKAEIKVETDFAVITVVAKDDSNDEFLLRHSMHQLLKRYKDEHGDVATGSLLSELEGYHRSTSLAYKPVELKGEIVPAKSGRLTLTAEEFERRRAKAEKKHVVTYGQQVIDRETFLASVDDQERE